MDKKMKEKKLTNYPDSVDTRVALLEQSIGHINQSLINMDSKMEKRFDEMEKRFDKRFDVIDQRFVGVYSCMKWMAGLVIGLFGGMFAIMAHGFHWF